VTSVEPVANALPPVTCPVPVAPCAVIEPLPEDTIVDPDDETAEDADAPDVVDNTTELVAVDLAVVVDDNTPIDPEVVVVVAETGRT